MPSGLVSSALVLLALALAGCGGGDDSSSTTASTATGTAESQQSTVQSDIYFGALDVAPARDGETGVLVRGVERGSPAATAGVQPGDVITGMGGKRVASLPELAQALNGLPAEHDPGDKVRVLVVRGSRHLALTATLAPRVYLGAEVTTGTAGKPGVVVQSTQRGSPAASKLKRADVITAVDGTRVHDVDELYAALGTHVPGDAITLTVIRGAAAHEIEVTLELAPRPGTT